jgi:hypothetical protein
LLLSTIHTLIHPIVVSIVKIPENMIRRISRVSAGLEQKPVPSVSSLERELESPAVILARPGKEAEEDVEDNGVSALLGWPVIS